MMVSSVGSEEFDIDWEGSLGIAERGAAECLSETERSLAKESRAIFATISDEPSELY